MQSHVMHLSCTGQLRAENLNMQERGTSTAHLGFAVAHIMLTLLPLEAECTL